MKTAILLFAVFAALLRPAWAGCDERPDYRAMADGIQVLLEGAAADYRAGRADQARAGVQKAYFSIFEAMEGPIRINLSAKRAYQLEAEFGAIRKMMGDSDPAERVESRVKAQNEAIHALLPTLEAGAVLVGRRGDGAPPSEAEPPTAEAPAAKAVEPAWRSAVETIRGRLDEAAAALEAGDAAKAKELVRQAQFEGYKNSQLEIAVRRHVSQQQDAAYKAEFARIQGLIEAGRPAPLIRGSARVLADEIGESLPGLPLVGAAAEARNAAAAPADWAAVAARIDAAAAKAVAMAGSGRGDAAAELLQSTYFDVFEASGMEAQVGARDTALKTAVEAHFSKLVALAADGPASSAMAAEAQAMKADLARAAAILGETESGSPFALLGYALLIILREGFEAMLIVTAMVAYLVKTGHGDKQKVVVHSVGAALLASLATAALLKLAFREAAAGQETLEGATMLVAAAVLFSMSFWLVAKAEARRWNAYISGKVQGSLSSGSIRALWWTCFLAVYREGAETVLFFQALTAQADTAGLMGVAGGFALGCAGLAALYLVMRAGALRLPIRPFFQATGALLYGMAFVFAGRGVMELVEGKLFAATPLAWAPEFPALGIYPYVQSLAPQAALVIAALISLAILSRRPADRRA